MLLQRVLTAAVLLPMLLALVFWTPTVWVVSVFGVAGALAAREWAGFSRWGRRASGAVGYALMILALTALAWFGHLTMSWVLPLVLAASLAHWLWAAWALAGYPQRLRFCVDSPWSVIQGAVLIVPTVLACGHLHTQAMGAWWLLFAFFLVFAADVGAYFAGRRFGRHKLAPAISPGKTREGAVGGLLLCGVWAGCGVWMFALGGQQAVLFVLLCAVIGVFSILGDLLESACKRLANVKDSGTLLPGHGGMLDRIDSVVAALPLFVLGLMALGLA